MVLPTRPHVDGREAQAQRVADYLELHPASTGKEIDAACDAGCLTKVLSEMDRPIPLGGLGYRLTKGWRSVLTKTGKSRKVRTYSLLSRPVPAQPDLFNAA